MLTISPDSQIYFPDTKQILIQIYLIFLYYGLYQHQLISKKALLSASPNPSKNMSINSNQDAGHTAQDAMIRAIQQYIDRHNVRPGDDGARDLRTLHAVSAQRFYTVFNSNLETGLSGGQVTENGNKYGVNQYRKRKKRTLFQIFKEAICEELLLILMVAAVVSVVVEYFAAEEKQTFWIDGVAIMAAVLVCAIVQTMSNYQKEKQFNQLDALTENSYNYQVLRDGKKQEIHRSNIVVGDIIFLTNGMEIPADCLLYKSINVVVNQSAITGQTQQIYKNTLEKSLEQRMDPNGPTPIMISGANVISGEGLMMAVVTGKNSRAGKNFQLIFSKDSQDEVQQTALERQLDSLASRIGRLGIIASISIFLILMARLIIEQIQKGGFQFKRNIQKMVQYLIIAITTVVISIPQGLPLAVTLNLAYSMRAMYQDKILVRKLESCQTMGAARYLCSDKTGTITQNKMVVREFVNTETIPIGELTLQKMNKDYFEKLSNAIFHNTSADAGTQKGPQTQIALLKMERALTGSTEEVYRKNIGPQGYFKRLPFDSSRKRMTTGLRLGNQDILFMNGASEQILQASQSMQDYKTGQILRLTPEIKNNIQRQLTTMADKGLRTVSIAYKIVDGQAILRQTSVHRRDQDVLEPIQKSGFTLLGVFGIEDPPRPQSKQAILNCRKAGINVIMVTGDNKVTATSIAEQVGIISDGKGRVLQANQFIKMLQNKNLLKQQKNKDTSNSTSGSSNNMKKIVLNNQSDQLAFQQIMKDLVVIARSKPQHKYILVDGIDKLGYIVGVTGDGANDAPALMRADIGMAMGITGTQVAKNASDIIILDDNFSSIVKAVVWGRNVYESIRRYLQFQLTVTLIAVSLVLISAAVIRQSVLSPVQMLWMHLCTDSLAALALATWPPNHQQFLSQPPNDPDQSLLTPTIIKHIIGQSIFQLTVLLFILFYGPNFIPEFKDGYDGVIGGDLQAKYFGGIAESTVTDGKMYTITGQQNYKKWFDKYHVHSRHLTFLFNTFVFLQICNFICCRKIKDELSLFSQIFSNKIFWVIVTVIVGLQILLVTFGGRIFQLYQYGGLTILQWLISVGIGLLTIPVNMLLRVLPICKPKPRPTTSSGRPLRKLSMMDEYNQTSKSIQKTNRKYIKPATYYNQVAPDIRMPISKMASRKSLTYLEDGNVNFNTNVNVNQNQNQSQNDQSGGNLPYGYQFNSGFNQPR